MAAAFLSPGQTQQAGTAGVPGGVEFEIISGYNPLQPRVREAVQRRARTANAKANADAVDAAPEAAQ